MVKITTKIVKKRGEKITKQNSSEIEFQTPIVFCHALIIILIVGLQHSIDIS